MLHPPIGERRGTVLTMSPDKNEKAKPKEVFLNRNKELSKGCSEEPGSRDGGIENRDSRAKCCYPIFKLEKLRQKSNRREFANDRQITCVLDWTFECRRSTYCCGSEKARPRRLHDSGARCEFLMKSSGLLTLLYDPLNH